MDTLKSIGFISSGWDTLVSTYKKGKPIDKREILALLDKGEVPDITALPMLADIIRETAKMKEGASQLKWNSSFSRKRIVAEAYFYELYGKDIPDDFLDSDNPEPLPKPKTRRKNMNGAPPTETAKLVIAERFGMSQKTLENILAKHRKFIEVLERIYFVSKN